MFVISNTGDADLVIQRAKPACGCTTAADVNGAIIKPGASMQLPVSLSLKGRSGPQRKAIKIFSNDPEQPELSVWIKCDAIRPIQAEPRTAAFGRIESDETPTQSITLSAAEGRQFIITKIEISDTYFAVDFDELIEGEQYRLNVKLKQPIPQGPISGSLTVYTTDPDMPTIQLPVTGLVPDRYAVTPAELVLLDSGKARSSFIIIGPGKVKSFTVTGVTVPDNRIKASIHKAGKYGYRVHLTNLPSDASLDGKTIDIKTDVKEHPLIKIPIRVESARIRPEGPVE